MAIFDLGTIDKFFRVYDEKKVSEPHFQNDANMDKYDEFQKLKMSTNHFIKEKRMLVIVSSTCSTDDRTGSVSQRLMNGTKKIRVVFEQGNQRGFAVVELPSKLDCTIPISDAKKQEILDQVKLVNKTNNTFSESVVHYENLIQNLKVSLNNQRENVEIKTDQGSSIELQGKEMVRAKRAPKAAYGKKIKVKQNNKIVEKTISEGDILVVRVDGDKNFVLDENGDPIRDVLSEDEFNEKFGHFYGAEEVYVAKNNAVILNLKSPTENQQNKEIRVSTTGFKTEASHLQDNKVQIPFDPFLTVKENVSRFAKEMEHVRSDLTNMANFTFCTSNGNFLDPEMAKLLGQELDHTKTRELIYKPGNNHKD